jgi:prepilin-type N-terminal cleavage/methylation domain-containing protein
MKLPFTIYDLRFTICKKSLQPAAAVRRDCDAENHKSSIRNHQSQRAFTMVEIAISLAIIGIALVGIIGVLPMGLSTQRDSREDTIINQDATVFIETIGKGALGADDLTNYVYAITNYQTTLSSGGTVTIGYDGAFLTNGLRIVGLLSTPEFEDNNFMPANPGNASFSNYVVAYVRSISGPAVEKPPQDNPILQQDSFSYRILCVNAPLATASPNPDLQANLHELRLTFEWPQLPNGGIGGGRQTYRATIGGQLATNAASQNLYFYQPQSFVTAPPPP